MKYSRLPDSFCELKKCEIRPMESSVVHRKDDQKHSYVVYVNFASESL